ncbi:hypothetical protein FACS1894124_7610 [Spirochaetia bacterium]|nr:hypothetical protein FACS1894124_7610 [Spirochaetia bacterium]
MTSETSGSLDTLMEVYDDTGTRLQANDDGGEGENARISFFAEAGRVYLAMVRGYSSSTGAYRFHAVIEPIPDEEFEPNDTLEQAYLITLGEPVRAMFNSSADEDWYKAEIPAEGAGVTVYTEGSLNTYLAIYNAEGTEIAQDDDSGSADNARITLALPEGIFYIKAALSDSGDRGGIYTLQTRVRPAASLDSFEPDNQVSQAKDIEIGVPQQHSFSDEKDIDWVRLQITEEGQYGIRARGVSNPQLDTYIELFDADEELIDENDDGGDDFDAYLSITLSPGVYYLKITTLDREAEGEYTLSVEQE